MGLLATVIVGRTYRKAWQVARSDGMGLVTPLVIGDFSLTLLRDEGSGYVSAPETVVFSELIAPNLGTAQFAVDPNGAFNYQLWVDELHVDSFQRAGILFEFVAISAGSIFLPTFDNAYCSQADVEREMQHQIFDSASKPTDMDVAAWAEIEANRITAMLQLREFNTAPATIAADDSKLEMMVRHYNSLKVALNATRAGNYGVNPASSAPRIGDIEDAIGSVSRDIREYLNKLGFKRTDSESISGSLSRVTHMPAIREDPIGFEDEF